MVQKNTIQKNGSYKFQGIFFDRLANLTIPIKIYQIWIYFLIIEWYHSETLNSISFKSELQDENN